MKKQRFVLAVLLAFAFCAVALPASGKDQGKGKGPSKADKKQAKEQEKAEQKHEKFHDKADLKQARVQEASNRDNSRFSGLDRNNDGVITRDEWRGNDRSFANQDWNGDGVLSGDEVRPGARRPDSQLSTERRRGRFADLDRNNDGVIARNEWPGDRQAFDRMDANRDGVLSRDEFSARMADQNRPYGRYEQRAPAYSDVAQNTGYRDGLAKGQNDARQGKSFSLERHDAHREADNGYNSSLGNKEAYRTRYREAFRQGYEESYRGSRR